MSLTVKELGEQAAKAIQALHDAIGQGDHSPVVDEAVAKLSGGSDGKK